MADLPKRVWSGKKQVYSWKKPVWVKDWKLWVYDPNFEEVTNWQYYSPNRWGNVSSDAELQIYDDKDSLNPTDIGTFEDWLESTYQFVDYDSTVLKSWKVKDGETPVAPADPTREHYTFTGWNPTVWPINKNTTYSAVYAIDTFTVNIWVNDPDYGDVSISSLWSVPYWTAISASDNVLTIGETTITATAETWYQFSSWGTLPATVTEDLTITATFVLVNYTVTATAWTWGSVSPVSVTVPYWTTTSTVDNVISFSNGSSITATPDSWYAFDSFSWVPATITGDATITATFEATAPLITTPWIYRNEDLWLISFSSDGTNWTTISDKNLWAIVATNSNNTSERYAWKVFQRGNNYSFARDGVSISNTSNTQVDVDNYSYTNPYSSDSFIIWNSNWWIRDNFNLRWAYDANNKTAHKWPCPDGYHIPTSTERNSMKSTLNTLWIITGSHYLKYLYLPVKIGYRSYTNTQKTSTNDGYYWTASTWNYTNPTAISWDSDNAYSTTSSLWWANGCAIRPFKDTAVQPNANWTDITPVKVTSLGTLENMSGEQDTTVENLCTVSPANANFFDNVTVSSSDTSIASIDRIYGLNWYLHISINCVGVGNATMSVYIDWIFTSSFEIQVDPTPEPEPDMWME